MIQSEARTTLSFIKHEYLRPRKEFDFRSYFRSRPMEKVFRWKYRPGLFIDRSGLEELFENPPRWVPHWGRITYTAAFVNGDPIKSHPVYSGWPKDPLTDPGDIATLLEQQPRGEKGFLLNASCESTQRNIFRVANNSGVEFELEFSWDTAKATPRWVMRGQQAGYSDPVSAGSQIIGPGILTGSFVHNHS